jgi:Leucine-rich repeat (LRR) protein
MCRLCAGQAADADYLSICESVIDLPYLPLLKELYAANSQLQSIPDLPSLAVLDISGTSVRVLPKMPVLEILDAAYSQITIIPNGMPLLKTLDCTDTEVSTIPEDLLSLENLYCSNTLVTKIPDCLTSLKTISCVETSIQFIPNFPILDRLYCESGTHCYSSRVVIGPDYFYSLGKYPGFVSFGCIQVEHEYVNAFTKLRQLIHFKAKLPTLWKIAEYYTARKYAPNNALRYISLD